MDQKIWMKKVPTHPSRDLEGWGAGEGKGYPKESDILVLRTRYPSISHSHITVKRLQEYSSLTSPSNLLQKPPSPQPSLPPSQAS